MKLQRIRWIILGAIFIVIVVGLISSISLGTLSSFGWEAIASICPLGVLESFLAGRTIFLRALVVLAVIVFLAIILGKVFCAWVCPVAPIRSFTDMMRKHFARSKKKTDRAVAATTQDSEPLFGKTDTIQEMAITSDNLGEGTPACSEDCSSCAVKRAKRATIDSRHIVLGGTLFSAAVFGFPVFCLICPIGLIFATIVVLWQWLGLNTISWSLLLYPALLIIELLVLRKWCFKFCPVGALLSLLSLPNRFFKPQVDNSKCLREKGIDCNICVNVCPEELDPHFKDGMNECTKCGLCKDKCPVGAITIPFKASSATPAPTESTTASASENQKQQ